MFDVIQPAQMQGGEHGVLGRDQRGGEAGAADVSFSTLLAIGLCVGQAGALLPAPGTMPGVARARINFMFSGIWVRQYSGRL